MIFNNILPFLQTIFSMAKKCLQYVGTESVIYRTSVSGPVLQDYGSADPDPKE